MQQVRRCGIIAFGLCLNLTIVNPVFAGDASGPKATTENAATGTISIGTEILDGDTTYRIGYPITVGGLTVDGYFPFSELKWPLDVVMGRVDGSATFSGGWRINGYVKKNLSDPDGKLEDSDWITASNPGQLDIYSESNISAFDAFILDLDVEYTFVEKGVFSFYGGIGYQYQNFDFNGKLIQQYSPSGLPGYDFTGDGRVAIAYRVKYNLPYLLVGTDIQIAEKFSLKTSIAVSPYVTASDEDNHYLAGKVTKSDMDGYGIMLNLSGKYAFTSVWFLELGVNFTKIEVDGTMDQFDIFGNKFASNKVESESNQTSGYINFGANF